MTKTDHELTALLIAADQDLARQIESALSQARAFQVLASLRSYPTAQTLDVRLRQLKPDVVFLDLQTDLVAASSLIPFLCGCRPPVHVIGIHRENHPDAVVRSLRMGASEFLHAPFDPAMQREAAARIRRLGKPEVEEVPAEPGKVVVFSSAKPGAGSSTLALQIAYSIRRRTSARVLLADFDLAGGTLGESLNIGPGYSALNALRDSEQIDPSSWVSLMTNCGGIDVLPPPPEPSVEPVEPARLHDVFEHARALYDWTIVDVPVIFQRVSLLALSESDKAFLVTTPELPSLHLARRAVGMLSELGFAKERFQVILNRTSRRDGIGGSDVEKILGCRVKGSIPNDYDSLHRMAQAPEGELGRVLQELAGQIAGPASVQKRQSASAAFIPAVSEG